MGLCDTFGVRFQNWLPEVVAMGRAGRDSTTYVAFTKPTEPAPGFNTYYLPTYRSTDAILAYILHLLSHHILSLNFYKLSQYIL